MFQRSRPLGFGKRSWSVALLFVLAVLVEGVLWYFMPIYFESKLNSAFLVGFLLAVHPIASLLGDIPSGVLCDKLGRKFVFLIGVLGFTISFVFLFMGSFYPFLIFMVLYGFFATFYDTGAFVSIMDHASHTHAGKSAGFYTSINYAGWFFGSLFAGLLITLLDIPTLLKVLMLFLVSVLFLSFRFFPGKTRFGFKEIGKAANSIMHDGIFLEEVKVILRFGKPLMVTLAFFFAFGFWEYAIWTFEPLYTSSLGTGFLVGAAILSLVSVPGVVSPLIAGKLIEVVGEKKLLLAGAILILLGQSLFLLQQTLLMLALSLLITSSGAMFMLVPIEGYIKKRVERDMRGHVDGAWALFYDVGGILGPLATGFMLAFSNISNPFYFTFPLFAISIALLFLVKDAL